jgi:multiple antibiotic resistance protein
VRNKDVMKQLPLGRYVRIIEWTIVVIFLALAGLVFLRLFSKGLSELLSLDPRQIINTSIQLFAIINPLSALPTFMVYTEDVDESSKRKIVNTTVLMVIALVLAFALFGQLILNALQITVESFMLGGGLLLMIIAVDMLGGTVRTKTVNLEQVAIVPLATPLLVGPGTMTTLIVLANTQRLINVLIGGIIAAAAVFLTLRYSDRLADLIGKNGILAGSRLMAIILAAIAANMIHGALIAWGIAKA